MTAAVGFQSWVGYVNTKKVDFSADTFTLFLTNSAPDAATDEVLADITEISYANCSSRNLTLDSAGETAGTYTATFDPLTLTATGTVGPFRYLGIYDNTATNDPLLCYYDYGSSLTLNSGDTFTFTPSGATWTDAPA